MFTPFAFVKTAATAPAPPVENLLLDDYPNAAFAYSVRKLRAAYNGSCMNIRRSSDGQLQDIGFDGNGYVDVAAITSFVGGGTGHIRTWYDQSGNGVNASLKGSSTEGFFVVNSGTLQTLNGKLALYTPNGYTNALGGNYTATSNNVMWFDVSGVVNTSEGFNTFSRVLSLSVGTLDYDNCSSITSFYSANNPFNTRFSTYQNNGAAFTGRSYTLNTQNINFNYKDQSTVGGSTNASAVTTADSGCGSTALNTAAGFFIGRDHNSNADGGLKGWVQEVIFWPTYTSGNVNGIRTNINTFFGTY
jgi:hypothetical protein